MRNFLVLLALVGAFTFFVVVPYDPSERVLLGGPDDFETQAEPPERPRRPPELETAPKPAAPGVAIRGRVVRVDGEPVKGVRVVLEHAWVPEVSAVSDASGAFQLTPAELRGDLVVRGSEWLALGGERTLVESKTEGYLLVVAEPVSVHGKVVDELGNGVEGARIFGHPPTDAMVSLKIASLPVAFEDGRGYSAEDGTFAIGPIPRVPRTQIEVTHPDFAPAVVELPAGAEQGLRIVLER